MKSGVVLTVAGLAGIAVLVGQMYAGARPGRGAAPVEYDYATSGGIAGGTVCDSIGPDVIVGVITGPSNYSSSGGIEAFTIGTTSCNIGDQVLNWIASGTDHPVIGQNLFRLNNGRFEQIGQAWLKHGFGALQGNACGCGCTPADFSHLGVGCSDPYGSGLNGQQNGMGPKFQVNAYTGAFIWPPADFSATGNSVFKRIQAKISDLDPAQDGGGDYFVEAQYVTPAETAAGNQFNNVSYRPCTITGGGSGWSMSLAGTTQRENPAIEAWRLADPAVTIVPINVPGDGRLHLGHRVTDLGGGMWHYEYALHNMNSDRSAGSFSVPIPAGVTVSNAGFHDVDYHSGEPYDGTDWPVTVGGSDVSWLTDDFTTNPDANALRWGTMYNYRFDADSPPTPATVEIGLFKPGTPALVTATAVGPTELITNSPDLTGPLGVPDGCVDAFDLGAMLGAWCSAVNDPNPPSPPCENCTPANLAVADISGAANVPDGCVDAFDLAKLLADWCSVAGGNPCGTCL